MQLEELERRVSELRLKPLKVLCQRPDGSGAIMSLRECVLSGSSYICVIADELDHLLAEQLEERNRAT